MNTITEHNFSKKQIPINIEIVIDVISSYLFYKIIHNDNQDLNENNIKEYFKEPYQLSRKDLVEIDICQNEDTKKFIESLNQNIQYKDFIKPLNVNYKLLRKKFRSLRYMYAKDFYNVLGQLNNTTFNFNNFSIPYYDIESKNYIHIKKNISSPLLKIKKSPKLTYDKHNRILNCEANINLNTKLGMLLFYNICHKNYNVVPNQCYSLLDHKSKTSYLIYRKLILPYYGKVNCPLRFETIKNIIFKNNVRDDHFNKKIQMDLNRIFKTGLITEPRIIKKNDEKVVDYERKSWTNDN